MTSLEINQLRILMLEKLQQYYKLKYWNCPEGETAEKAITRVNQGLGFNAALEQLAKMDITVTDDGKVL